MFVFHVRFWKVLRSWTTAFCSGSTTRPKPSENASPWARLWEGPMKSGAQPREPCIQPPWSLSRAAPRAGTRWTTTTRKALFHTAGRCRHNPFTVDENVSLLVCSMGGIPAVGGKGERLLLFIGIIDILQSYR